MIRRKENLKTRGVEGLDRDSELGGLLQAVLKKHPVFSANPIGDWQEIAGQQVAQHSCPLSLKKKVLVIAAYDSVWKHHLELNREALLDKINGGRPELLVEKIVVRVGKIPDAEISLNQNSRLLDKLSSKPYRGPKKKKTPSKPLTPEEKTLLKTLSDPELRVLATRLLKHLPPDD